MPFARARRFALASAVLLAPAGAQAAQLELDRVWGNEAGCAYLRTLAKSDPGMLVLSAHGLEMNPGYCEWAQVGAVPDGTQVATGLCGSDDGSHSPRVRVYTILRDIADQSSIRILDADGTALGELRQCR